MAVTNSCSDDKSPSSTQASAVLQTQEHLFIAVPVTPKRSNAITAATERPVSTSSKSYASSPKKKPAVTAPIHLHAPVPGSPSVAPQAPLNKALPLATIKNAPPRVEVRWDPEDFYEVRNK